MAGDVLGASPSEAQGVTLFVPIFPREAREKDFHFNRSRKQPWGELDFFNPALRSSQGFEEELKHGAINIFSLREKDNPL